ncbi:MAG: S41 family peptidase [Alphaproteobacteria bacterium]|nr:S41 family peptidase [Alphaproteobacteria bacterium]
MNGFSLGLLSAAGVFCGTLGLLQLAQGADSSAELARFGKAYAVVRANYVEPPGDQQLVEGALSGMLGSLDPHSSYFDPRTFAAMQVKTEGQYGGVGLVIGLDESLVTVISPIEDSPASKAGIKAGDHILSIDGKLITGQKLDDVQDKLRGPAGTKVMLGIMRQGLHDPFDVTLKRQVIAVEAVTHKRQGDVGYIRLPAFNEHTDSGLRAAVAALKKEIGPRLKGYIIDLRDNGGGLLDQAVAVSDDFLGGGEIVSIRGRSKDETQRFDAQPGDIADGKPVIILVNGGSASASEIVAGALQDHKRARVEGSVTFGKGSVQTVVPLENGKAGALHLTTARYYTPSGRSIQTTGIVPDIAVSDNAAESNVLRALIGREADLPRHLAAEGPPIKSDIASVIRPDPKKTYPDFQLSYAVQILQGKAGMELRKPHPRP